MKDLEIEFYLHCKSCIKKRARLDVVKTNKGVGVLCEEHGWVAHFEYDWSKVGADVPPPVCACCNTGTCGEVE